MSTHHHVKKVGEHFLKKNNNKQHSRKRVSAGVNPNLSGLMAAATTCNLCLAERHLVNGRAGAAWPPRDQRGAGPGRERRPSARRRGGGKDPRRVETGLSPQVRARGHGRSRGQVTRAACARPPEASGRGLAGGSELGQRGEPKEPTRASPPLKEGRGGGGAVLPSTSHATVKKRNEGGWGTTFN